MNSLFGILLGLSGLTILVNILLLLLRKKRKFPIVLADADLPYISVLVAARNEEAYLPDCLDSLLAQDYPAEKLEIWVGNDQSTDRTAEILAVYAKKYPMLKVLHVKEVWGSAKGKSNVLAQLAKNAGGDYLVMTDADMQHPKSWLRNMLSLAHTEAYDMVTGITLVQGERAMATWQRMDWLLALGMVEVVSTRGIGVTAMGNNMLVRRDAYRATGGYEALPFSITEDFQLYRELRKQGGKTINWIGEELVAFTRPIPECIDLLHQRKRWMRGAVTLPPLMVALLGIQAVFFPVVLLGIGLWPMVFLPIALLKILSQSIFISQTAQSSGAKVEGKYYLTYEFYSALLSLSLLLFYALPIPVQWKGRNYR
jgi:cellulose synthase/poly-beta-1,6-N-acetylglucosamine synthase-like glycosyltransferase